MHADQVIERHAELLRHPPAVLQDLGRIVARAEPAIEAGIDAFGDAALAREEGVAQARYGRQQR
ncbi:hypothetical protein ACVILL_004021 [Bradyrhizobium sp. USDA 3364]